MNEYEEIIDVKSAKERFMGNGKLFTKFLYQFPERSLFTDLEKAIADGDAESAFLTAHTMKGIVGNLSLKLAEKPLLPIVELLRKKQLPAAGMWKEFSDAYSVTVEAIKKMREANTTLF